MSVIYYCSLTLKQSTKCIIINKQHGTIINQVIYFLTSYISSVSNVKYAG